MTEARAIFEPELFDWKGPLPFGGATFDPEKDNERLGRQLRRVLCVMWDGQWRTLRQISDAANCPEASASARLRDINKPEFYIPAKIEKANEGEGLWKYRLVTVT